MKNTERVKVYTRKRRVENELLLAYRANGNNNCLYQINKINTREK